MAGCFYYFRSELSAMDTSGPAGILAADDSTMEDNSQALAVLLLLPLLWETNEGPQSWPYARC